MLHLDIERVSEVKSVLPKIEQTFVHNLEAIGTHMFVCYQCGRVLHDSVLVSIGNPHVVHQYQKEREVL